MLTKRFAPAAKPLIAGAPSDCAAQPTRTRICRDSVGTPALEYPTPFSVRVQPHPLYWQSPTLRLGRASLSVRAEPVEALSALHNLTRRSAWWWESSVGLPLSGVATGGTGQRRFLWRRSGLAWGRARSASFLTRRTCLSAAAEGREASCTAPSPGQGASRSRSEAKAATV